MCDLFARVQQETIIHCVKMRDSKKQAIEKGVYEGWNFNSGNYLFTTDTK